MRDKIRWDGSHSILIRQESVIQVRTRSETDRLAARVGAFERDKEDDADKKEKREA